MYAVSCPGSKLYIGKTSRPLKTWIGEQPSNLRNRRLGRPFVSHFTEFNYTMSDLIFWVVDKVPAKYERSLLRREINWIFKLTHWPLLG